MHEQSITVNVDGKWINFRGVLPSGQHINEEMAVTLFRAGLLHPLGGRIYDTEEAAINAAKSRSKRFGRIRGGEF